MRNHPDLLSRVPFRQLGRHDWVVYAKKPFGSPRRVLDYLARYTHRVSLSNHRLLGLHDGIVHVRWRDYAHGGRKKVLFDYVYHAVAEKRFQEWFGWARRSHLEPIKKVAKMIRDHRPNVATYFVHRITNAGAESINSLIQNVKRKARGFRNRENFKTSILFDLGGLDLLPDGTRRAFSQ